MTATPYPQGTPPDPRNDPTPPSALDRLREEIAGQYAPIDAPVFIQAGAGAIRDGSPSLTQQSGCICWLLDASSIETVGFAFVPPPGWATYTVKAVCFNPSASSGDVVVRDFYATPAVGEVVTTTATNGDVTAAASSTQYARFDITLGTMTNTVGDVVSYSFRRNATAGGDTLANDLALVGLLLEQAS